MADNFKIADPARQSFHVNGSILKSSRASKIKSSKLIANQSVYVKGW